MDSRLSECLEDLTTPCFLVDINKVKKNCKRMRNLCDKLGVNLRCHMKTHKTREAGELMTDGSKKCIAVSTLREAEFFAEGGFDDILYAFTFTKDKLPRLERLNRVLLRFHVLVDSKEGIDLLESHESSPEMQSWSVWLKADCGYHRSGVAWNSEHLLDLVDLITHSSQLSFQGIYAHDGDSYNSKSKDEVTHAGSSTADRLLHIKQSLIARGLPCPVIATGSTPSCSLPGDRMSLVDEFHPGNYIFYDYQQLLLGSCQLDDIAGRVMTRVIGHYPEQNTLLVDSGFTALSHDGIGKIPDGSIAYVQHYPDLKFHKMSQEVGYITSCDGKVHFSRHPLGSILFLIPYHSCATASMHSEYFVHEGNKVLEKWTPCRGW